MSIGTAVVVDTGSHTCKAGFAGDDAPVVVLRSIVGRSTAPTTWFRMHHVNSHVGDDIQGEDKDFVITHPIQQGIITNWNDMEKIWQHIFLKELCIAPDSHPILLTEAPLGAKANRERMAQMMFETFNCPALYVALQVVLSLYTTGNMTGIVIDSGEGLTHVVPIHEGYVLPHAIERLHLGGRDLTNYLTELLVGHDDLFSKIAAWEIACDVKEKLSYVALDFNAEMQEVGPTTLYKLPDGGTIAVGGERFRCPEVLFQPNLLGRNADGIHDMTFHSIQKCAYEIHKRLYGSVVLSGGTTMFAGIGDRMVKELTALAPATMNVRVIAPPQRMYSAWIGGSILASLDTFQEFWITRTEYEDFGAGIVHRKCI